MKNTRVIDRGRFKATKTDEGFLNAPAQLCRTGVQFYTNPDGTTRREYRPADEVFDPKSLATLKLLPVTLGHPPDFLTPENYKKYAVGTLGESQRRKNIWVASEIRVNDSQALNKIEEGVIDISLGYTRDIDATPGVSPDGEEYDLVQRNIRYNHAAILPKGRAGEARLILDAAEQTITKDKVLKKLNVNGVTFEVEDQLFDALTDERKVNDGLLEAATNECDKEKARADVAVVKLSEAQKVIDSTDSTKDIADAVKARVALERIASKVLDGVELSEKTEREIKCEVVAKENPALKLEDQSDAYVQAAFDIVCASKKDALDNARQVGDAARVSGGSTLSKARANLLKRNAERASASLKGAK